MRLEIGPTHVRDRLDRDEEQMLRRSRDPAPRRLPRCGTRDTVSSARCEIGDAVRVVLELRASKLAGRPNVALRGITEVL